VPFAERADTSLLSKLNGTDLEGHIIIVSRCSATAFAWATVTSFEFVSTGTRHARQYLFTMIQILYGGFT